jgi:hypothetical protein
VSSTGSGGPTVAPPTRPAPPGVSADGTSRSASASGDAGERQAFWTLVVGAPAAALILRLWVEAGGDLQTTLLLVANVGSINMVTAFLVTAMWLISTVLVGIMAIGTLTAHGLRDPAWTRSWRLWSARVTIAMPYPLRVAVFALAAVTWQILYLPLLALALCIVFRPASPGWAGRILAALAYAALFVPTLLSAVGDRAALPALLIVATPVLVLLGAARPLPRVAAVPFATVAQAVGIALLPVAVLPTITAPVLPLTVVMVGDEGGSPPLPVRGYVVEVNDASTAVLRERGGVRFIANTAVTDRVLCPDPGQTPHYRLWLYRLHIEDSLLQGIGRLHRPAPEVDPRCRPSVPELGAG